MKDGQVTLYPMTLTLSDWDGTELRTITVYETVGRIDAKRLPKGWHRLAMRDCGQDQPESIERFVWVDHIDEFITQADINDLLDSHQGSLMCGGQGIDNGKPIVMPASIFQ